MQKKKEDRLMNIIFSAKKLRPFLPIIRAALGVMIVVLTSIAAVLDKIVLS